MVFNFHGYPWLIHQLAYRRANRRLPVAGTHARERFLNARIACRRRAHEHGMDDEAVTGWRWPSQA